MDSFMILVGIVLLAFVVVMVMRARKGNAGGGAGGTSKPNVTERQQILEDIKMTQTSRVVDAVQIIDELSSTSKNFRQYCELIGHAQATGGVTAPYSKKQVAYYDLRCYRVDANGETLVAHEKSVEPFYFTDDSCDTPVYVDLDSFGTHSILVNSTDRMEGPDSDFSKALAGAMGTKRSTAGFLAIPGPGGPGGPGGRGGRPGGPGGPGGPMGHGGFGGQPRYGGQVPSGLDSFLGGMLGGNGQAGGYGGPAYRGSTTSSGGTEALIGMGLGMLLSSMMATPQADYEPADPYANSNFRGYHVVEDVVPLSSPVYCLGELYRTGDTIHMGKSLSESYPSYYFATKHEAELIQHLS